MLKSIPSFHLTSIRFGAGAGFHRHPQSRITIRSSPRSLSFFSFLPSRLSSRSSSRVPLLIPSRFFPRQDQLFLFPSLAFAPFDSFVARLRDGFWLHLSSMRLSPSSFSQLFFTPSFLRSTSPNQAMQRTLRARHEMCCRTSRAVPYVSLILFSLGDSAHLP